jgi:tetratricopeptide (TPR) repeat protein
MANITLQEAYNRAKEALEAGEIDRAVAICQYVLRYYPRYVEGYRLLGEAYLEHGGLSEAGRLFSHVLSCDPQHVLAHVGRAIIAEEHGLAEVAISELERGFEVDPSIGELRAELLRLYKVRYGTAGAYIRTTPLGLAYTHLRAGLLEPAIAEFSRLAEAQPDRWDAQVALLEALWRNEQVIDAGNLASVILADHPNCVKANWILGYLHWTGDKLDTGREYLSAAVALDPDYGTARKLWANTPWPLDPVVTAEQPALVPGWARDELVMEEDLNLALPMALDEEPLATTPSRAITTKLADEAAATSPYRTAELSEEAAAAALATIAAPGLDEEPDGLAGGALDVILPMPEAGAESPLPEPTSLLDTVLAAPAMPDAAPPPEEPEASAAEPPPPPGAWFQQWAQAALNPAPAPPPAPPAEETIAPADSPVIVAAAPGAADTVLPVADAAPAAPEDEAPASPLDVATIAPAEAETAGEPPRPAAEMGPVLTIVPTNEDQPPAPTPDQPAAGAAPAAAQPAPPAPLELALEPGAEAGAAAGEDEALLTETGEAPIRPAAPLAGEPEPAPLLDETIGAPAPGESAEEAPPAASPEPPAEIAADAAAQPVGPPLAEATPAAAAAARPSAPPPTSHDAPTTPAPDEGHQSAPILETVADSAMKENTMAPSYKEDDDQERQFEFDWEREGLPDYLKPFLAEDSGAPAPVPPAPAAPASPGDREAAASGSAGADSELPDLLSAPPSTVPTAPAAPVPPSFGPAPTAGMGGFSAPEAQAGSAGGIDLDQEGLPDWLRPSPAQPPPPPPPGPPPPRAGGPPPAPALAAYRETRVLTRISP